MNFVHVDKALRKLNRYNVSAEDMERIRADSPPRERQRRTGDRAGVIVFNVPSMEVLFVAQTFTRRGLEKTVFTYPSGNWSTTPRLGVQNVFTFALYVNSSKKLGSR